MNGNWFIKVIAPALIVAFGALILIYFKSTNKPPERKESGELPTLVNTITAQSSEQKLLIEAMGAVEPDRMVTITPEVAGRIIYVNPQLTPGGHIKAGETLIRIDPRDYDLAIKMQQATVAQASLKLDTEKGLKAAAEKEWELIKDQVTPTKEGRKLALRETQLESAQTALESAQSGLDKARLDRSRTSVKAPFDAFIISENVDIGQVVARGSIVAQIAASENFILKASVPIDQIEYISFPESGSDKGSQAVLSQSLGDRILTREGYVSKLLPDLDPMGKMARVIIKIEDPFMLKSQNPDKTPLLLGSYVKAVIEGPVKSKLFSLPRGALRDNNTVWIMTGDNKLDIRPVTISWRTADSILISKGLNNGDKIVTSRIQIPIQDMKLKSAKQAEEAGE